MLPAARVRQVVSSVAVTVAALNFEPLGFSRWRRDPISIEASLLFPPKIVDPSGSVHSNVAFI